MAHSPQEAKKIADESIAEELQKVEDYVDSELEKRYFGQKSIDIWFEAAPTIAVQERIKDLYTDAGWHSVVFIGTKLSLTIYAGTKV